MRAALVIAGATLLEALRNRLLLVALFFSIVLVLASIAAAALSFGDHERMIIDLGLAAASGGGSVMAVALAVSSFAAELRKRTAYTLLARPLSRWAFVLGKLLGVTAAMWLVTTLMVVATAATVLLYGGTVPGAVWASLWLTWIEMAVVCAVATLFSSLAEPVLAATYSAGVLVAGNLADDLVDLAARDVDAPALSALLRGAYQLLPDLQALSARLQAANALPVPDGLVLHGTLYGVAYAACAALVAMLVFGRRRSI
jgi:Cu-processing system permease protein